MPEGWNLLVIFEKREHKEETENENEHGFQDLKEKELVLFDAWYV